MKSEVRIATAEALSRQPLFRGLDAEELHDIASGTVELRVRKNEVLFHKGDLPEGMHVLVMGQVKLLITSAAGTEKVVHTYGPGSTFGEAMLFLDRPYPVTAQATVDSIMLLIGKHSLLGAIDTHPGLARKMLASLSQHLHGLVDDMEICGLRNSVQRVLHFFNQSLPASGVGPCEIQLPVSKQTIASQLNLAPETLSRVLGSLVEAGLIRVQGRTITVLDRQKLLSFDTSQKQ